MVMKSLAGWGATLAAIQAVLVLTPMSGPIAAIARHLIWIVLGVGFLYWIGQAGLSAGDALGAALRPPA